MARDSEIRVFIELESQPWQMPRTVASQRETARHFDCDEPFQIDVGMTGRLLNFCLSHPHNGRR